MVPLGKSVSKKKFKLKTATLMSGRQPTQKYVQKYPMHLPDMWNHPRGTIQEIAMLTKNVNENTKMLKNFIE